MKHYLVLVLVILMCGLIVPVSAQTPRYARVITANANLRDTPSIASDSDQAVSEDTLVKVLDEKLPWYVVRVGNRVGWMHGNTLEFINTQSSLSERPQQHSALPEYRPTVSDRPPRDNSSEIPTRTTNVDRAYIRGPRGGCYYYSGSGRKVYVDRSLCN